MALPLQILPQEESFGSKLGTGLGSGIGAGLQNLAQMKLNEISQQKQAAQKGRFWQDLGLPASIGSLPDQVQKGLLDRLEGVNFGGQGGMPSLQQPGQEISQENGPRIGASPAERRHQERLSVEEAKVAQKREEAGQKATERAYNATKDIRKEIITDKRAASKDLATINSQEELNKSGKLVTPLYYSALKSAGLDIPALLGSPESEAYVKNTMQFLGNAKQIFGGRLTNFEVEQFLKSLPTLENTKDGREIILKQMKNIAQGKLVRYNAFEKILAENQGTPPFDLNEQIERRAGRKLDKLAEKFVKIVSKENPKDEYKVTKKVTSQPTQEGTRFRKKGSNEVMIIRNGKAVPEKQGEENATGSVRNLRTFSF